MKNIKRRKKRSYFGYIFTFISILVVFLIIPQILFVKSAMLMKGEKAVKEAVPPSANFYIAKNYLDLLVFFPGFTKKSKEIVNDVSLFYAGKYMNEIAIKKDSITDILIGRIRLERDSIFENLDTWEQEKLIKYYDSLEDRIIDTLWINNFENKKDFCEKWSLFFEKTEFEKFEYTIICN